MKKFNFSLQHCKTNPVSRSHLVWIKDSRAVIQNQMRVLASQSILLGKECSVESRLRSKKANASMKGIDKRPLVKPGGIRFWVEMNVLRPRSEELILR